MVFSTYVLFKTQTKVLFRAFLAVNFLILSRKSRPTCSAVSCSPFSKSQTINQPQQSTESSIYAKQSLDFRIIIKKSSYRSIGLHNIIIHGLFIVKRSYKDQRQNVSTQFLILWCFCDLVKFFECQSINTSN